MAEGNSLVSTVMAAATAPARFPGEHTSVNTLPSIEAVRGPQKETATAWCPLSSRCRGVCRSPRIGGPLQAACMRTRVTGHLLLQKSEHLQCASEPGAPHSAYLYDKLRQVSMPQGWWTWTWRTWRHRSPPRRGRTCCPQPTPRCRRQRGRAAPRRLRSPRVCARRRCRWELQTESFSIEHQPDIEGRDRVLHT